MTTKEMATDLYDRLQRDCDALDDFIQEQESLEINDNASFLVGKERLKRMRSFARELKEFSIKELW